MDVNNVSNSIGNFTNQNVNSQAVSADTSKNISSDVKTNKNPLTEDQKQRLMKTYSNIRNIQPSIQAGQIVNTFAGNTSSPINNLSYNNFMDIPTANENTTQAATQNNNTVQAQTADFQSTNKLQNTENLNVSIANNKLNTNNQITGPAGFASQNNEVTINGADNIVNLEGIRPKNMSEITFQQTGGADIDNNNIRITGNSNNINFNGTLQNNNTINVNGAENNINLGNNIDGTNININGNNINLNINDNDLISKNNNNWNINISADNVKITIENGIANIQGDNLENLNIEINNNDRTVTVSTIPKEEQVQTVTDIYQKEADSVPPDVPVPDAKPNPEELGDLPNPAEDYGV